MIFWSRIEIGECHASRPWHWIILHIALCTRTGIVALYTFNPRELLLHSKVSIRGSSGHKDLSRIAVILVAMQLEYVNLLRRNLISYSLKSTIRHGCLWLCKPQSEYALEIIEKYIFYEKVLLAQSKINLNKQIIRKSRTVIVTKIEKQSFQVRGSWLANNIIYVNIINLNKYIT